MYYQFSKGMFYGDLYALLVKPQTIAYLQSSVLPHIINIYDPSFNI